MNRRRLSPLSPREAVALDAVVAAVVGVLGAWRELSQEPDVARFIPLPVEFRVAVQIVAATLLLWRRQRPLAVGLGTAVLCLLAPTQSAPVAAYSVAAHTRPWQTVLGVVGAVVLAFSVGAEIWRLADPFVGVLVILFGALLGRYVQARRDLLLAALVRAERAEEEQLWRAEQAVALERGRLAGDMHDLLSHRLGVLLLQAGALAATTTDPVARRSIDELRRNSAAALTELREVFGALGTHPDAPPSPDVPGRQDISGHLDGLIGQWRTAGADVDFDHRAEGNNLSAPVARTLYRVVQEALTNAAKHAPGGQVSVTTTSDATGISVSVHNRPGTGSTDSIARNSGGGMGLFGLQQRVQLVGGDFTSGPLPSGGFEVAARLPTELNDHGANARLDGSAG